MTTPQARLATPQDIPEVARRTICWAINLKRNIACGCLPGYDEYATTLTAEDCAKRGVWGDFRDPVLSFQIREGFRQCGVVEGYLPEDGESDGCASVIVWLNPEYDPALPTCIPQEIDL